MLLRKSPAATVIPSTQKNTAVGGIEKNGSFGQGMKI